MKNTLIIIVMVALLPGCEKFVDVGSPATQLDAGKVFSSDQTATAAQLAIYASMESDGLAYNQIVFTGISADELTNFDSYNTDIATNNLTPDNFSVLGHWQSFYRYSYQATAVLEGLKASASISETVRKQLEGEARFVRAFCYFYLVNFFGDAPVAESTDYRDNAILSRKPVADVYSFILQDLEKAMELLSDSYLNGKGINSNERVRPNKFAAASLLARVYLYTNQWSKAETTAGMVIDNSAMYSLVSDLEKVFLKNSKEAIWQWQSVVPGYNTYPGAQLILYSTPYAVALDTNFVNSFHPDDNRRSAWIGYYSESGMTYPYPFKYKIGQNEPAIAEYTMVLRLSEQYLIRSEARAMQDKLAEAESDLNSIRVRAGLAAVNGLSRESLLDSIQQERNTELFAEFGDRWFNLKRTGKATSVLSLIKGSNWSPTDALYPVPQTEINLNKNLSQNPGY